ncbi:MAG: LptF/LptG family permease [Acidobacteriales bacterium]|nr:LptF/LptG family permease [Terriglobales bacterium]
MRILRRYILREVVAHGLIGAGLFTFVVFMRDVGRLLELVVRNSAPFPSVAEVFFLTIPAALTVTIPMGVLVGILIGLSRLAADSEVTAMRASGLGASLFLKSLAIFALLAWLLASINTLLVAPRSAAQLSSLQDRLKTSQASFEVQPQVFYEDFKNYVLYIQDSDPADGGVIWKKIFLADISTPGAPKITLANEAIAISDSPEALRLHLINGSTHESVPRQPEQYSISTFGETDQPIPLPAVQNKTPKEMAPIPELTTSELLRRARADSDPFKARWYWIEFHRRLALPSACIVLALIGIPLGLSAKKGGKATGFVLTIILVFVYYFISLFGVTLARQGKVSPALGVWLSNGIFLFTGLLLLWRADRRALEIGSMRGVWNALRRRFERSPKPGTGAADAVERSISRRRVFSSSFPQILDDLVLRDFGLYLSLVLASFVVLMLVFNFFELLNDIFRNRVPLITVGEYLIRVIPTTLYDPLLPLAVLIAVLVTFGLMEKANEITAMKATGTSIYRIVTPVLVIAGIIAATMFFTNEVYLPESNKRQERLRNQIKGKPAQTFLRPDRKWIFGKHSTIYYYEFFDADRNTFGNISAFEFDPKSFAITKRIYAARAHWEDDLNNWVFEQGWSRTFRGAAIEEFRTFDVSTFSELSEPPAYFKKEIKQSSEMNYAELSQYIDDLQQSGFDVVRLRVQLHKKFAYPLIAFVMAVLAIPFAFSAGRRGALSGVATALGIGIAYWVTSGLFEALGNINQLPPALAAWSPDLIFALVGGYLILKVPT